MKFEEGFDRCLPLDVNVFIVVYKGKSIRLLNRSAWRSKSAASSAVSRYAKYFFGYREYDGIEEKFKEWRKSNIKIMSLEEYKNEL